MGLHLFFPLHTVLVGDTGRANPPETGWILASQVGWKTLAHKLLKEIVGIAFVQETAHNEFLVGRKGNGWSR